MSGESKGAILMVVGAFFFSLMSLFVKLLGVRLPSQEIVFLRALLTTLFSVVMLRRAKTSPWGNNRRLLLLRGFFGFIALSCFYYAITRLPIAEATVIQYTNPIFTTLLAAFFLDEKIKGRLFGAMGISLLGVLLVTRPGSLLGSEGLDPLGASAGMVGAILSAAAYITVRKLRAENPLVVVFYMAFFSTVASLPLAAPYAVLPQGWEWAFVLGIGVTTQIAQISLTRGLALVPAGRAMTITYVQIIFAALWGMLALNEIPGPATLAGATLVALGSIIAARIR